MKFGMAFANALAVRPDAAVELAQAAEAAGFDSLWTVEHVVVPSGYESPYPYSRTGKMLQPETDPLPDPLVWLAYVAAATEHLRLATGVIILPERNPLILAKEAATLDLLSGGRLLLGVGSGWLEEEFDALGVSFADRGARTDEYIRALRALWGEGPASFEGDFASFANVHSEPSPPGGSVPIVIGGHSPRAARRAGELGDGFYPAGGSDRLPELLDVMRRSAEAAGRDPDAIEVSTSTRPDPERIERLQSLGVDRLIVAAMDPASVELFGKQVIG